MAIFGRVVKLDNIWQSRRACWLTVLSLRIEVHERENVRTSTLNSEQSVSCILRQL